MKNVLRVVFHYGWTAKAVVIYVMALGEFVAFDPQENGEAVVWLSDEHSGNISRFVTEALQLTDEGWVEVVKDINHCRELGD